MSSIKSRLPLTIALDLVLKILIAKLVLLYKSGTYAHRINIIMLSVDY